MQRKLTRLYVCGSVLNRSEQLLFSLTPNHIIGLLHSFSHPDYIEVTRNGGQLNPCLKMSVLWLNRQHRTCRIWKDLNRR
jgi:hypothetical protein